MNRRYTFSVISFVVIGLLVVATFNGVVDPYGVIGAPRIEGFNAEKPEARRRERLSKAYEVRRVRPDAVLLGTSRAKALDPAHPHFAGLRSYNLAISSSSIYEQLRYFELAMAVHPIKEAVVGVDFDAFREDTETSFSESRLSADRGFDPPDLLGALLSVDALRSSVSTLRKQSETTREMAEFQATAKKVRRNGGQRVMFRETEAGQMHHTLNGNPDRRLAIGSLEEPKSFRKVLRSAHRANIKLYLFISPYHARYWEAWQSAGAGPRIEQWKRALVAANAEEAMLAGREPFPLWDFSGYNGVTTEAVPPDGDIASIMRGYSEGSHYSAEAGRMVMDRIFGYRDPARQVPKDFGVLINEQNIETHLAAIRAARDWYREAFPQDIAELSSELERQKRKRAG